MPRRDAHGRFLKADPATQPDRPFTILAIDRRRPDIRVVNRRADRLISHRPSTRVRFETEDQARDYLARLPIDPRYSFAVDTLTQDAQ